VSNYVRLSRVRSYDDRTVCRAFRVLRRKPGGVVLRIDADAVEFSAKDGRPVAARHRGLPWRME